MSVSECKNVETQQAVWTFEWMSQSNAFFLPWNFLLFVAHWKCDIIEINSSFRYKPQTDWQSLASRIIKLNLYVLLHPGQFWLNITEIKQFTGSNNLLLLLFIENSHPVCCLVASWINFLNPIKLKETLPFYFAPWWRLQRKWWRWEEQLSFIFPIQLCNW